MNSLCKKKLVESFVAHRVIRLVENYVCYESKRYIIFEDI